MASLSRRQAIGGLLLFSFGVLGVAEPAASAAVAAAPAKAAKPAAHAYRIQVRQPRPFMTRYPSSLAAKATAANLRRQGFSTSVKNNRTQHVVVAKMARWKNRGVAANPAAAASLANGWRARGFQARVVAVKR